MIAVLRSWFQETAIISDHMTFARLLREKGMVGFQFRFLEQFVRRPQHVRERRESVASHRSSGEGT